MKRFKHNIFFQKKLFVSMFFILGMVLFSCDKDESSSSPPIIPPGSDTPVRHYHASAAIGDIVSITVNDNNNTISYENETTGESGTVPFSRINTGIMRGALNINVDGDDYYFLEIPEQMILTYLPFSSGVEMVVGVAEHNYTPGDHYGTWLFFGYDPHPSEDNYWGVSNLTSDGRFDLELWDFMGYTVHSDAGEWWQDTEDPSIIYSLSDTYQDTIKEIIYVLPDKLRVFDFGPQQGMGIAFVETNQEITMADIQGTYLTLWEGGYGNFVVESNGDMTANFYVYGHLYEDIDYSDLRRTVPGDAIHYNNTFFFTDHLMPPPIQDVYMFFLPGDAFLAIYYDEDHGMQTAMAVRVNR